MTIQKAIHVIRERNMIPKEDDWELMEAADTLLDLVSNLVGLLDDEVREELKFRRTRSFK